ncbi:Carboxylesterase family-domain-containing protein [Hypoxylon cercidicola]|nr:Carboxylesterase family-domain-containing protein [Hypoxylon cercidicola]
MDPLYTGRSLLRASNYQTIFITGNYRVGAFGWLSGHYMQKAGQPNAGLYDQALLLKWVQKYVDRVKGDKTRVSAWGESAGGGSILHHLIREDGTQDPLFSTFAVQSPGFQWAWDNSPNGELDNVYRNFSKFANCGYEYNINCLRAASVADLTRATQKLFENFKQTGLFTVGPAVDGKWIKSIPTLAFSRGKFWKGIKSAIISHCANEPYSFTPKNIDNETRFDEFIYTFLPGPDLEPQRDAVKQQYDCKGRFEGDFHRCAATIIRDLAFTCNTRDLFNSYSAASYMMEYAFPLAFLAIHASDLIPLYANNAKEIVEMLSSFHPGADRLLVEIWRWGEAAQLRFRLAQTITLG